MTSNKSMTWLLALLLGVAVAMPGVPAPALAGTLTDSAVFSSNDIGRNWNGLIWNTQGSPDLPWNLYYSTSSDPQNPSFLNTGDGGAASLNINMTAGVHSFLVYGEAPRGIQLDPFQHFVLSLYFDGNQGPANISGNFGSTCPSVCAVSDWNGLDLFGNSGLGGNTNAQEAGTLVYAASGLMVELTQFNWALTSNVDQVWPHWDNMAPFNNGSGLPDFVGQVVLNVTTVPEPSTLAIFALGLASLGFVRRRLGAVRR